MAETAGIWRRTDCDWLEGGHSGSEIDKEHANANILMGRVLKYLSDRMELAVVSLAGGLKDNAIPRECEAEIVIPEEKKAELSDYITELEKILKKRVCGLRSGCLH